MKLYTAAALACFLLVGCSPAEPSIPDLVGTVPPFEDLQGVHLGIQASTIAEQRQNITIASYSGYQETVDGYHIVYHFPLSTDRPPSGRAQMRGLSARKAFVDSALAALEWRNMVAATTSNNAQPPTCYQAFDNNEKRIGYEAEWNDSTASVIWKYIPNDSVGNDSSLVMLQFFYVEEITDKSERVAVACP